jgi:hypothetical protein
MLAIPDSSSTQEDRGLWHRWRPWLIVSITALATLALLALVLVVLPPLLVPRGKPSFADLAKAESDIRGNLVAALGVLAVLIGGVVGFLNFRETQRQNRLARDQDREQLELARDQFAESQARNREQVELQRRGQVTERFSKAIEQLGEEGDGKVDVRVGAIYALEQIAKESDDLHWPIMEVLTTHLRHFRGKPQQTARGAEAGTSEDPERARLPTEAQAIATVIGRRRHDHDPPSQALDLHEVDLSGVVWPKAHLESANLYGAHLQQAHLVDAHMQGADLSRAELQGADLGAAHLQEAKLYDAQLQGAYLDDAQLQGADLSRAQLQEAQLVGAQVHGAVLAGAKLQEADLEAAQGATHEQISSAVVDDRTRLPIDLVEAAKDVAPDP